ncbi:MAG: Ig domain-containing protein [Actinomycetota bacterium]
MSTRDQSVFLEGDDSAVAEGAPTATSVAVALAAAPVVEQDRAPFATGELRVIQIPDGPGGPTDAPEGDDDGDRPIPLMFAVLGAAVLIVLLYAAFQARTGADDATTSTTEENASALTDGIAAAGDSPAADGTITFEDPATAPTLVDDGTAGTATSDAVGDGTTASTGDGGGQGTDGGTDDPAAPTTVTDGSTLTSPTTPSTVASTTAPSTTAAPTSTTAAPTTTAGPTTTRALLGRQLRVLPPRLPETEEGDPVDVLVVAVGGEPGPVTFSADGLPPGLSIDPATGRITGTPQDEGVYSVRVTVSQDGAVFSQGFTWVVDDD